VDAALGLQQKGHEVDIWTSHHDKTHCFQETRDGTLNVRVHFDFIPRHIFGKFHVVMAILRNILVALVMLFSGPSYDVIFCDQISVTNPLLKLRGAKVLFYCHFPDKLLSIRKSVIKKIYRFPVDLLEEVTTGMRIIIVVVVVFATAAAVVVLAASSSVSSRRRRRRRRRRCCCCRCRRRFVVSRLFVVSLSLWVLLQFVVAAAVVALLLQQLLL